MADLSYAVPAADTSKPEVLRQHRQPFNGIPAISEQDVPRSQQALSVLRAQAAARLQRYYEKQVLTEFSAIPVSHNHQQDYTQYASGNVLLLQSRPGQPSLFAPVIPPPPSAAPDQHSSMPDAQYDRSYDRLPYMWAINAIPYREMCADMKALIEDSTQDIHYGAQSVVEKPSNMPSCAETVDAHHCRPESAPNQTLQQFSSMDDYWFGLAYGGQHIFKTSPFLTPSRADGVSPDFIGFPQSPQGTTGQWPRAVTPPPAYGFSPDWIGFPEIPTKFLQPKLELQDIEQNTPCTTWADKPEGVPVHAYDNRRLCTSNNAIVCPSEAQSEGQAVVIRTVAPSQKNTTFKIILGMVHLSGTLCVALAVSQKDSLLTVISIVVMSIFPVLVLLYSLCRTRRMATSMQTDFESGMKCSASVNDVLLERKE